MRIAIVFGTRPEIIKLSPLIKEFQQRSIDFCVIHSNQHYTESMDSIFFKELRLPVPQYRLGIKSGGHPNQIDSILFEIEPILAKEKPNLLIVQGDTNTALAAALMGRKFGIKIAHIEAGLRSYDVSMPEESNRFLIDHIADYLFAVTEVQKKNLECEGIAGDKIFVVGNTISDSIYQSLEFSKQSRILDTLHLSSKSYTLLTIHRGSNVDDKQAFEEIIFLIQQIPGKVVWPIHVRTLKMIREYSIELPANIITTDPLGYFDFLQLETNAKLIVTDSGGVQEEACILGIPCITLRENTERPETLNIGANILVGRDFSKFMLALNFKFSTWTNPFGDGFSSKKICEIILGKSREAEC